MMEWLWPWSGKCFGYRESDELWTHDGYLIGQLAGNNIFGIDGKYLGEIINDRLITNKSKKSLRSSSFSLYANRVGHTKYVDYVGYAIYAG